MAELPEPYLKFGLLCERVLEEKDGVLTFVRVVDRFTLTAKGRGLPAKLPPMPLNVTAAMGWWGGLGKHVAQINIVTPTGTWQSPEFNIFLDSLERGQNVVASIALQVSQEGLDWAEFLLNGRVKSRMPFRIFVERVDEAPAPQSEAT